MQTTTTAAAARSTETHRRGHAYYGTDCPVDCDRVAKWAARRLITPRAFLAAIRAGHDLEEAAAIIGVLPVDLCSYLAALDPDEWLIMQQLSGRDLTCRG